MFRFHVCFFVNFSSFKLDNENNANVDAVSSKCKLQRGAIFKHIPKLIIFGTHNHT